MITNFSFYSSHNLTTENTSHQTHLHSINLTLVHFNEKIVKGSTKTHQHSVITQFSLISNCQLQSLVNEIKKPRVPFSESSRRRYLKVFFFAATCKRFLFGQIFLLSLSFFANYSKPSKGNIPLEGRNSCRTLLLFFLCECFVLFFLTRTCVHTLAWIFLSYRYS